ncbi:MAG TPA: pyridoxamine 5'-phosphate oxidase family protein [Acidimicrobiales bacterium]|nr:pyridoxamine 5'-phosphate oxidase family protein [Acidimicrobiales bacterium]
MRVSRPLMPGYGVLGPSEGTGLLPWSWAEERLVAAPRYWLATVCPDGRPHVMPVWAVWDAGCLWFSSSLGSRKARNLDADQRVTVTTDNTLEPVVLEGIAERMVDLDARTRYMGLSNAKYATDYPVEFLDPKVNGTYRVTPHVAFGLIEADFVGSPTRWVFP